MTYQELVAEVKKAAAKADASKIQGHIAFQFNVTGEGEGAFYLEIADGKVNVEPYEYFDRDVLVISSAENIIAMMNGKLDPVLAFTLKKITVEGDLGKALVLKDIVKAKKAAAKKPAAKKADAEPKKAAEKKPAAKKPAAKKTAEK